MSRYSLWSDVRAGIDSSCDSGLLAGTGCRTAPEYPGAFCVAGVGAGLAAGRGLTPAFVATLAVFGRVVAVFGRAVAPLAAVLGRVVALGLAAATILDPVAAFLAEPAVFAVLLARAAVPPVLAAVVVLGFFAVVRPAPVALDVFAAAAPRRVPVPLAMVPPARVAARLVPPVFLAVVLAVLALLAGRFFAVVVRLAVFEVLSVPVPFAAAIGFTADIVLAAAVSALEAVLMALVAAFIACNAVDMVLADDVALVAALVILVAAELTFAAAEDTVRAAAACVIPVLDGEAARVL
jgi:hypothetical protein